MLTTTPRILLASAALAGALAVLGCVGVGTNTMQAYTPVTGKQRLSAVVPDGLSPTEVTFTVDKGTDKEKVLGKDNTPADQFTVEFDTTTVPNGVHYVKAESEDGTELLSNSIFVQNGAGAGGGASPGPAASPP